MAGTKWKPNAKILSRSLEEERGREKQKTKRALINRTTRIHGEKAFCVLFSAL